LERSGLLWRNVSHQWTHGEHVTLICRQSPNNDASTINEHAAYDFCYNTLAAYSNGTIYKL